MPTASFLSTDPRGLKCDPATGDLQLVNGRFSFATGLDAVAQDIVITLRLFMNEWFLNLDAGIDWFSYLGEKLTAAGMIALQNEIQTKIVARPGVISLIGMHLALNDSTRGLSVSFTAHTAFGDTAIATEVSANG